MTSAVALAIGRYSGNDNINRGAERKILFALNDGKRFVVRADEKLTALAELESVIRDCNLFCLDSLTRFFQTRRR
jgi:hypothetical protein